MNHIPNKERILLCLHPDVRAESRLPNEVSILHDGLVDVIIVVEVVHWRMLLAPICMLLDLHPPIVDTLHYIDSHVSQS